MKKCTFTLFIFSILINNDAFASGTLSLTTYYPAPTAAYNKVTLATAPGLACLAAPPCPNGTLYSDGTGTLHVWMNGKDTVYPQECYNTFCSYAVANPTGCNGFLANPCPTGFTQQPVNLPTGYDQFNADANTMVDAIVCCSN
jgi:hypothetical protein